MKLNHEAYSMKSTFRYSLMTLLILFGIALHAAKASSLTELARQGDADAQVLLGYQYLSGMPNREPSMEKAKYWMRKAAEQGDADAQGVLGTLYYNEKNYTAATPWLSLACKNNNQKACLILDKIKNN